MNFQGLSLVLAYVLVDLLRDLVVLLLVEALSAVGHAKWRWHLPNRVAANEASLDSCGSVIVWNVLSSRDRSPTHPCAKQGAPLPKGPWYTTLVSRKARP